jgi:REP element-mobilizing transposase RayT
VEALTDELQIDYHREFTERFHQLLDAGHGECVLARQACADLLIERLLAGHPKAYRLDAWCVMPNHLHALVQPMQPTVLGEILRHWKGGSARDINLKIQRQGPLWLRETFDHIVRSQAQLDHFRRYINKNPKQAGLKAGFVVGLGRELLQRQHAQ